MTTNITPETIFRIAPSYRFQWEQAQDCYVILYPEGMVKMSGSAGEILQRVDGERNVETIISAISQAFDGADVGDDVIKFLEVAHGNGWLSIV